MRKEACPFMELLTPRRYNPRAKFCTDSQRRCWLVWRALRHAVDRGFAGSSFGVSGFRARDQAPAVYRKIPVYRDWTQIPIPGFLKKEYRYFSVFWQIICVLKVPAQEDAKSHWLHLFDFSPLCIHIYVSSNGLPEWMQSHIGCICLTFLHCVF